MTTDPAVEWADTGHLVSPPYEPHLEAVRRARGYVMAQLVAIGLPDCSDDAGLMVSELAANAVLHARSVFQVHVRPTLEGGVRVEVHDLSPLPPVFTIPSTTALSGRGLNLVQTMATRWGSHPLAAHIAHHFTSETGGASSPATDHPSAPLGKIVWFELDASGADVQSDSGFDDLLALWSDEDEVVSGPGDVVGAPVVPTLMTTTAETSRVRKAGIITSSMPALNAPRDVIVHNMPVAELLAAKEAVDDLLREVQLLLLATPPRGARTRRTSASEAYADAARREQELAERLDVAARDFEQGRRQVHEQLSLAAARGQRLVTLVLNLPAAGGGHARPYRDAVEEASRFGTSRHLLSTGELERHLPVLRRYLDEVVRQLE